VSRFTGFLCSQKIPAFLRPLIYGSFGKVYGINFDEMKHSDLRHFETFNKFFTRELKDGVRTIVAPSDPTTITSPCDGRVLSFGEVDTTDSTILRIIVDDPDLARSLLQEHGFAFTETAVVVVEIAGERQLQDVLAALLEAELNIHYTYPFLNRPAGKSALVLNVEHPEVAVDSLRRHYFTVLYQGDVSR
jgi:phosphatidylserine decarboxylase